MPTAVVGTAAASTKTNAVVRNRIVLFRLLIAAPPRAHVRRFHAGRVARALMTPGVRLTDRTDTPLPALEAAALLAEIVRLVLDS